MNSRENRDINNENKNKIKSKTVILHETIETKEGNKKIIKKIEG